MRLRVLAGAYAGQIHDYSTVAGLAALRSGTAEAVDAVPRVIQTAAADAKAREAPPKAVQRRRPK